MAGTTEAAPPAESKQPQVNRIGLSKKDYGGLKSTLCIGCGHDLITARIIDACYNLGVRPENVAKLSGIGCSSKTPAYFLNRSHGFNSVHGRMPAIATGVQMANKNLKMIAVSGDGDSANIGMGHFVHVMRRNLNLLYIVENNGVYGLTKGQFSATADKGSKQKSGNVNPNEPIDLCEMAYMLGCGFVARLFAGNSKQMTSVIEAAIAYKGLAFLDIISPCVTFNNHEGSTKSFAYAKGNEEPLHDIGFVPAYDPTYMEMDHGEEREITLSDGSHITLKALSKDFDPSDRVAAGNQIMEAKHSKKILTGLIYVNPKSELLMDQMQVIDTPLSLLTEKETRPAESVLKQIMDDLA
jgi:2-oxoglutarate ferredoxin oxidoreductase subunit beta